MVGGREVNVIGITFVFALWSIVVGVAATRALGDGGRWRAWVAWLGPWATAGSLACIAAVLGLPTGTDLHDADLAFMILLAGTGLGAYGALITPVLRRWGVYGAGLSPVYLAALLATERIVGIRGLSETPSLSGIGLVFLLLLCVSFAAGGRRSSEGDEALPPGHRTALVVGACTIAGFVVLFLLATRVLLPVEAWTGRGAGFDQFGRPTASLLLAGGLGTVAQWGLTAGLAFLICTGVERLSGRTKSVARFGLLVLFVFAVRSHHRMVEALFLPAPFGLLTAPHIPVYVLGLAAVGVWTEPLRRVPLIVLCGVHFDTLRVLWWEPWAGSHVVDYETLGEIAMKQSGMNGAATGALVIWAVLMLLAAGWASRREAVCPANPTS
jgi:hypothetical protein